MQLEGTIANSTKMTAEDFEKLVEFRRPLGARIRAKGDSEDGRREGIPPEPGAASSELQMRFGRSPTRILLRASKLPRLAIRRHELG